MLESLRSSAAERKKVSEKEAYIASMRSDIDLLTEKLETVIEKLDRIEMANTSSK